jgi:hypothetical protein
MFGTDLFHCLLRVQHQRNQNIVEFMGQAGSEGADRRQTLLVPQLAFQPAAFHLLELALSHLAAQLFRGAYQFAAHEFQILGQIHDLDHAAVGVQVRRRIATGDSARRVLKLCERACHATYQRNGHRNRCDRVGDKRHDDLITRAADLLERGTHVEAEE